MKDISKFCRAAFIGACFTIGSSAAAATVDLVTNGDFEAGDTGFMSDLTPNVGGAATYAITTDPRSKNSAFTTFGDHTSGTGNMMVINGSTVSTTIAWEQTVSVLSGQTYDFSLWLADVFGSGGIAISLLVDGATVAMGSSNGPAGIWEEVSGMWNATSSGDVAIQVLETSTGFGGNDYALDDISFSTEMSTAASVPLPAGAPLLIAALGGLGMLRSGRRSQRR